MKKLSSNSEANDVDKAVIAKSKTPTNLIRVFQPIYEKFSIDGSSNPILLDGITLHDYPSFEPKLAMHSTSFSQFEVEKPANDNFSDIEIVPEANALEKKKWIHRFYKTYYGDLVKNNTFVFGSSSHYLVAKRCGAELGYLRFIENPRFVKIQKEKVFSISEIYVKSAYRNKKIAEKLIRSCVQDHRVQLIYLAQNRVQNNMDYFHDLGFTHYLGIDVDYGYLVHESRVSLFDAIVLGPRKEVA